MSRLRATWRDHAQQDVSAEGLAPARDRDGHGAAAPPLWSYAVPVLLPLRVAMRSFRKSYLAHAVSECGGDSTRLAVALGLAPHSIHDTLKDAGLPRLGDKATYTCGRCHLQGHNAATCKSKRRKP